MIGVSNQIFPVLNLKWNWILGFNAMTTVKTPKTFWAEVLLSKVKQFLAPLLALAFSCARTIYFISSLKAPFKHSWCIILTHLNRFVRASCGKLRCNDFSITLLLQVFGKAIMSRNSNDTIMHVVLTPTFIL